jgi:hypothetical protein
MIARVCTPSSPVKERERERRKERDREKEGEREGRIMPELLFYF